MRKLGSKLRSANFPSSSRRKPGPIFGATMMAGAAIYVVGLAVMAAAAGAPALIVSGGLIGVALSCTASSLGLTACAHAVSEERRSRMLGVVAAAGSLGTLLVPLATQGFLANYVWQIGALFFVAIALA